MSNDEKIKWLQDIVKIPSVNGNEEAVAHYIQSLLASHGIQSELIPYAPGRSSLVATLGNGQGKVLGLTGHMDVVSEGDPDLWNFPPFDGIINDGKLYGRGTTDMKSGLMAMVIAMIELKEQKHPFNGTVKLLATVGEEIGELGSEQLTNLGYANDLDGLIIGEPSGYTLVYAHMGSLNYSVTSTGKEAHSSMPQLGNNAINHLLTFMTKVNQEMAAITKQYVDEELGRTIHNITVIEGGSQVNSIPAYAKLQGNIRSLPAFDNENITTLLRNIITDLNKQSDFHLALNIDFSKNPVKANKNSSLIKVIQQQFKEPLPVLTLAGTTDAAEFTKANKAFDFVVFGPGVSKKAHQVDEYVEIDNYLDVIDKYQAIIKDYLK
ncbi:ArgE/DapE family deacylase [Vagococcus xieshaowenii]|uniref:Probable succinyl-diaminopimelate desuccinylase n=1 Tax=Vagococcus xieshaowenii TaxID=2562451 RepID=A0AAJ5EDJ9_9ENTE|nr:ArgE/DapE family deacylase [Vagococcus xieshaowenii]QCA29570.1 ArgE/DapE family deacylase [Vagococcus xieshaowenii]TFZ40177.1 ArgE/DapE family deacylase [Vagococcus xieshaowenii]